MSGAFGDWGQTWVRNYWRRMLNSDPIPEDLMIAAGAPTPQEKLEDSMTSLLDPYPELRVALERQAAKAEFDAVYAPMPLMRLLERNARAAEARATAEPTPQEKLENSITGDRWLRDTPPAVPAAPKAEKLEGNPWGKQFPFGAGGKNDR